MLREKVREENYWTAPRTALYLGAPINILSVLEVFNKEYIDQIAINKRKQNQKSIVEIFKLNLPKILAKCQEIKVQYIKTSLTVPS